MFSKYYNDAVTSCQDVVLCNMQTPPYPASYFYQMSHMDQKKQSYV